MAVREGLSSGGGVVLYAFAKTSEPGFSGCKDFQDMLK
jgi:hypothetical protein